MPVSDHILDREAGRGAWKASQPGTCKDGQEILPVFDWLPEA
jgi:hypothetical protein